MRQENTAGFTLIELMAAVAVIAALSMVALPSYLQYMQKSRTVEVVESLAKIAHGAKSYFAAHRRLPPSSAGFTPTTTHAVACTTSAGVFGANTTAGFRSATWNGLLFQPTAPYRYRYQFSLITQADPANAAVLGHAVAFGMGDLDCDNVTSIWTVALREITGTGELKQIGPYLWSGVETE